MSGAFGNTLSPSNQDSPVGAIAGKIMPYIDPISDIPGIGPAYNKFLNQTVPDATNRVLQPIAQPLNQFDQAVNPLRKIGAVNNIANLAYAKPGDAIGLAVGSVFTAGGLDAALAGAGGAGGAGAGAGLGSAAAADGAGAGLAADGAGTLAVGAPAASVTAADGLGGAGAGAGGLTGFFSGPAALGDAGMTGGVSAGGSGLSGAMAGDLGSSLGSAPTGLFSGLLPGGGMTGTASGALGGGLSGAVDGGASVGGSTMGGLLNNPLFTKGTNFLENQAISQGMQAAMPQQSAAPRAQNFAHSPYRAPNTASYTPTSAITIPYTLGGGGAQSLLQQIMQQRQNPLG